MATASKIAVAELQGDQRRLEGPEQTYRSSKDEDGPEDRIYPERRLEFHLERQGGSDNDRAQQKDHEHGRAIARIIGSKIESAAHAVRPDIEQASEERPIPATRATAA
jgi:hypothetical protein